MKRSSRAALVVVADVVLLALLMALPWAILDRRDEQTTLILAGILLPGTLVVVAWLVRLGQWMIAARARPRPVGIIVYLAQTAPAQERGRMIRAMDALASVSQPDLDPKGFSTWLGVTDEGTDELRFQRVLPSRWLMSAHGDVRASERRAAGVGIIDVDGHGRLWPASQSLTRNPRAVRLTPLADAAGLPRSRYLSKGRFILVVGLFLIPSTIIPATKGAIVEAIWGAAYVISFALAIGAWFAVLPPGWRPGSLTVPGRGSPR